MTITIDKGVKIPPEGESRMRYPFKLMKPGDSFFIPVTSECVNTRKLRAAVSSAALRYLRKKHAKFTIRTVNEDGHTGVRCWMLPRF